MTSQHYTHTCQVCKTEFHATLNKDGSIRKRKYKTCSPFCYKIAAGYRKPDTPQRRTPQHIVKIMAPCGFCKTFFGPLPPGQARRLTYCSLHCASRAKTHVKLPDGTWAKPKLPCAYCGEDFEPNKDKVKFCGHHCANSYNVTGYTKAVWTEVKALRSMAARNRAPKIEQSSHVKLEVSALRRIRRTIKARIIECSICQRQHVKRRPYMVRCSAECEQAHQQAKAQRQRDAVRAWKKTPKGRASRSAGKAARRTRINRTKVENIDPIAVFENANWVCHICGNKTLKSKRGTTHDRAPELEHIVALANGGTHTWSNVACACRKCNIEKGAKDYGQMGLL